LVHGLASPTGLVSDVLTGAIQVLIERPFTPRTFGPACRGKPRVRRIVVRNGLLMSIPARRIGVAAWSGALMILA
jgi:hypothetical protein